MAEKQVGQEAQQKTGFVPDEFEALLEREFKPKGSAKDQISDAVRTLAMQMIEENASIVQDDAIGTITAMISKLDEKLTAQINEILHHEAFSKLESAWRGLHYLVSNTETDETLKIRVMNISKKDLSKTLKKFKGVAFDQSPLFKKIYEEGYGVLGGEPFGCLVGDFHFDHSPTDVDILAGISQIAAAAHAPFISAAAPSVLQMDSWQELTNPRDLTKVFSTPDYAAWRALRDSDDAKYLALTMPRFLARLPYGKDTDPVEAFSFEEETGKGDSSQYCWANSAYAMAANINKSFKEYGWCSRIRGVESGGAVEGLPCHTFPSDDGGVDMKCPTEIAISDRREGELSKNGFIALTHRKNSNMAAFIGAQSLHKPVEFDDPNVTANAALGARLPYLFATCRFAHYLKCIVRDKIGSFKERQDMQRWLSQWILKYVDGNPATSSETVKAKKPLAAAEVIVEEVEGKPGYYNSRFYLRPHYQLEGLTVSLRLVSKLPSAG